MGLTTSFSLSRASQRGGDVDPRSGFESFRTFAAAVLGCEPEGLHPEARLIADLNLNELSLFGLVTSLQTVNPYFAVPEFMEMTDVTLLDVHSYFSSMTREHWEEDQLG